MQAIIADHMILSSCSRRF